MRQQGDGVHLLLLAVVVTAVALPVFFTTDLVNGRGDWTQYAARHEHLRQAVLEHGTWPARSHLLGGGYPIIGDPEDPSMNPLALFTLAFGTIAGLKLIGLLAMLAAALGMYLLLSRSFGLATIPAFGAALLHGLAPWIPVRMLDGNPNEVYYGFLPLVLFLLLGQLTLRRGAALLLLLWIMLSDGKLCFVTSVLFVLLIAALGLPAPGGDGRLLRRRPLLVFLGALGLLFLLAQVRIQPALDVISRAGGLARMDLWFHAKTYAPETINAYTPSRLVLEVLGFGGEAGSGGRLTSVAVGLPAAFLAALGLVFRWRRAWPWAAAGGLFAWLAMAHRAPVDLFRPLWELPVLNAIDAPAKYFSAPVVLALGVLSGLGLDALLAAPRPRLVRPLAAALVLAGAGLLFHEVWRIHDRTYAFPVPEAFRRREPEFFQVRSDGLWRGRLDPLASNTWFNLLRGVGTIDWYTGIPLPERAIPKFIIAADGTAVPNPDYKGEAFWMPDPGGGRGPVAAVISYESIRIRCAPQLSPAILLLNQSPAGHWTANTGDVMEVAGLLAVRVPPGVTEVSLEYLKPGLGLLLSITALIALAAGFWWWRRRQSGSRARC